MPARLEDNPDTWLAFTDLVFVDPVGTGYSRMLPGPDGRPGDPRPCYGIDGDVQALAQFIRLWLTTHRRWGSPKGLAGESYAGIRVAALSRVLAEQHGINLNRVALISPELNIPIAEDAHICDLLHPMVLLAARGLVLDTFDGTQASDNPTPGKCDELGVLPRSVAIFGGVLLPPFMDYVRGDLSYASDRPYLVLNLLVSMAWNRQSALGAPEDLAIALTQNTDLNALVVHGYQDLGANCMLSRYVLEQAVRSASARQRLSLQTYPGGHMLYLRKASRAALAADVRRFYEAAP